MGEARAKSLAKLDVHTVLDLLTYYPRRYIDRTNERRIDELDLGEEAMVLVTVKAVHALRTRSRKSMVTADVTDGTGFLKVTFFNQPFRERQLKAGSEAVLFGKVDLYPGSSPDDQPGRRPGGGQDGADRARVPAVREGRDHELGRRPVDDRGARPGRRLRRSRARPTCSTAGT